VNSAPTLADFDSRWLLLPDSKAVVHLWLVDGKIGYLDRSQNEPNHWIWLNDEELFRLRPFTGTSHAQAIKPDLEFAD
jgi:hypothetical protein